MSYDVITFPSPRLPEVDEPSIELAENARTISEPGVRECLDCYLRRMLVTFGCVGDHRFTRAWIDRQSKKSASWVLAWVQKRGGCCCDCEVARNALEHVPRGAKYSRLRCLESYRAEEDDG